MDPMGNWFDVEEPIITSTITDMRRESAGTWVPPDTVLNVNVSFQFNLDKTTQSLGSVTGLVIQATERTEFEDGLRLGSPGGFLSDNPSVRTSSLVTPVL